jgi:putative transposase
VSSFRRRSHTLRHCQYHVVWVPKYRFRILTGAVKQAAEAGIRAICVYAGCEVVELNVQSDHVHLVVMIPPKVSISELLGRLKGQTSMKLFHQFRFLRQKPYSGNHF